MYFIKLKDSNNNYTSINYFNGLCHESLANSFDLSDMNNICGDSYPNITTRQKFTKLQSFSNNAELINGNTPYWFTNNKLYCNAKPVLDIANGNKIFANMGNNIIVFPDRLIINKQNNTISNLQNEFISQTDVNISLADYDYNSIKIDYISSQAPVKPKHGEIWSDTNTKRLKQYNAYSGVFEVLDSIYTKIESINIDKGFKQGDVVRITGADKAILSGNYIIEKLQINTVYINAYIKQNFTITSTVKLVRYVPYMDFICVFNNRLWGVNSNLHEVYASALGDPCNFNLFQGISSDSFALSLANDEPITGLAAMENEILIFSENKIYSITGNKPANFRLNVQNNMGISKYAKNSLAVNGNTLYYISPNGIVQYSDGVNIIDKHLKIKDYSNGYGFVYANKYYISLNSGTYTYDNGRWFLEHKYKINSHAVYNNTLYFIDSNNNLYSGKNYDTKLANNPIEETSLNWYITSSDFNIKLPDNRILKQLQINMFGTGSFSVDIAYNSVQNEFSQNNINWQNIKKAQFNNMANTKIIINAKPCHHMRIRLSGIGTVQIMSMVYS